MDILKRNIGLVLFGLGSLVLAAIMIFLIQQHRGRAAELEAQVKGQQDFFESLRTGRTAVTDQNLEIVKENMQLTRDKLEDVREELWRRSHIPPREFSGVECKNILRQATLELARQLERAGTGMGTALTDFSFGTILQADTVPREKDVPMILKQLDVVKEVVRLAQGSYISEIVDLQRLYGLRVAETEFYEVMPMSITVIGESRAIRQFLTALQEDANFIFYVPYCTFSADDRAVSEAGRRPVETTTEGRVGRRSGAPAAGMPGFFPEMGMPYTPPRRATSPETGEETEAKPLDKATRTVALTDVAKAEIRLDFIQFRNPRTAEEM
jgi:hypothetical protein